VDSLLSHLGELAALGAAMCWVFTSLAFAAAGRRIGATAVNFTRIFLALAALLCINRVLFGQYMPPIGGASLWLLAASGLIGLAIGDQLLFTALVDVGPRISTLLMTLAPPVAAILAWPLLDEPLGWLQVGGIAVTLAGIIWVVLERPPGGRESRAQHPHRLRGVIFASLAGVCQAIGSVLSKLGMGHVPGAGMEHVDPWTATMYRMVFAAIGITVLVAIMRLVRNSRRNESAIEISPETEHLPPPREMRRGRGVPFALLMVCVGVTFGPVLGVWNSMVAVDRTEVGIAATLMAMTPVFILPFAVWIEKERISWRAAIGAMIAVGGVAILALANGGGGG
jgi:drug/metabolite transporter (DMT)-like permease